MASKKDNVNLDALIPREDLESKKPGGRRASGGIPVTELAVGKFYYGLLRKPQFQRETDDWSIDNVVALIKSYRDGHLIPAIILWAAEGYTFVIDGAHRLGALIAWVNDDYGDRNISRAYFGEIPKHQIDIAKKCREKVAEEVGTFSEISKLATLPNRTEEQLSWSSNIGSSIETQWVVGDADMAATSFLAINQRAVQIDRTERFMIEHRKTPNVMAARALVRSARGHAYWGNLHNEHIRVIEDEAKKIYTAIFEPENAIPDKSTELQPAGAAHTANGLRLALDLVNTVNGIKNAHGIEEDLTGENTVRFIQKTHGVIKYIAGQDAASLSLHPAVYFWGSTGNHRPSIFLATILLIQELIHDNGLIRFTLHRAKFEEFLVGKSDIGKFVLSKHGGWKRSVAPIKEMLKTIINGLADGKDEGQIEQDLLKTLKLSDDNSEIEMFVARSQWRETKAALRHKASLESAPRCAICKARLVLADASDDHKKRKIDGGGSEIENAQLVHRFCNHGFKEYFSQKGEAIPEITSPI